MRFLYDVVLALGFLCFLPKLEWERRFKKKQFPSLRDRFGVDVPDVQGKMVFWIHAVSVGEVKAAGPLVEKIRSEYPDAFLLITTASVTGQEEARRSLSEADAFRFLPLDFSWIIKRWATRLRPRALFFIEGDLWYHLAKYTTSLGAKLFLISGKVSARSARRYRCVPYFAKRLFSLFDLLLVQNEEYRERFRSIVGDVSTLHVTGNLKGDAQSRQGHLQHTLDSGILITCTHAPEEAELLDALQDIDLPLFLAPRHPERFKEVASLLEAKKIDFIRWSQYKGKKKRVILIDGMGLLPLFYPFAKLAIVAGSFSSKIGGHNVLEPCLYGVPVFFGPHMHQQKELAEKLVLSGAGVQSSVKELPLVIQHFLAQPAPQQLAVHTLLQSMRGSLPKVVEQLRSFLPDAKNDWQ